MRVDEEGGGDLKSKGKEVSGKREKNSLNITDTTSQIFYQTL